MSSPRTETAPEPADKPEKTRSAGLSAVQVAASALSAVSSAVLLSFFGVAGTLIGAALASVISTVTAALYSTSLKKTNERLRRAVTRQKAAAPHAPDAPATVRTLPAYLDPRRTPARRFRPRWGRVGVYAVSVFAVAMAIVTGIELIGQKPVSALVTHSHTSGTTTLGELTNASSSRDTTPAPPSSPTTTAPATSTAQNSPAEPTSSSDETASESSSESATPSTTSPSEPTSSSSGSSASPTRSPSSGPAPAPGTAPTP